MIRYGKTLLVVWTFLVMVGAAHAQDQCDQCGSRWTRFWAGVKRDWVRNASWPEPFLKPDRDSVMVPMAIQVSNGWRRQNLISENHFNDETGQLNQAGEMKVRFILTQMPPNRRTLFVQRGMSPEMTSARVDVVNRAAASMMQNGGVPEVVESDIPNDGWPADEIDAVTQKFHSTRPDPRLKNASGGGSSTSGAANN